MSEKEMCVTTRVSGYLNANVTDALERARASVFLFLCTSISFDELSI